MYWQDTAIAAQQEALHMKWRNWLAGLLAVTLLALTGCSGQQTFTADHLTVWIWDESQQELWSTLAQSWTEETGITVDVVAKDSETYWQELQSGTLPDLFWVDPGHAQSCIASGLLQPLDSYLEADKSVRLKDFYSQLLPPFQRGDQTYALPKDSSVTALWYNKTLFDRQELAYPDETWTWETLYTNAQKLTNHHNGICGLAIGVEDTTDGWYNLVYAYGGSLVGTDEEGTRVSGWGDESTGQAMELMGRLIRDCMPSQTVMAQVGVQDLFTSGHVAMVLQSSRDALTLAQTEGDWDCTLLPYCDRDGNGTCEAGERVSILTGTAWAISTTSADGAAAYDLLTVFCGEEGQKAQSAANLAQPAMPGLGEDWGVSLMEDLSAYRTTLTDGILIAPPVQLAEESWMAYAATKTMYTAWNNPDQMDSMLQQQQQYTTQDLVSSAVSETQSDTAAPEETGSGDPAGTEDTNPPDTSADAGEEVQG